MSKQLVFVQGREVTPAFVLTSCFWAATRVNAPRAKKTSPERTIPVRALWGRQLPWKQTTIQVETREIIWLPNAIKTLYTTAGRTVISSGYSAVQQYEIKYCWLPAVNRCEVFSLWNNGCGPSSSVPPSPFQSLSLAPLYWTLSGNSLCFSL